VQKRALLLDSSLDARRLQLGLLEREVVPPGAAQEAETEQHATLRAEQESAGPPHVQHAGATAVDQHEGEPAAALHERFRGTTETSRAGWGASGSRIRQRPSHTHASTPRGPARPLAFTAPRSPMMSVSGHAISPWNLPLSRTVPENVYLPSMSDPSSRKAVSFRRVATAARRFMGHMGRSLGPRARASGRSGHLASEHDGLLAAAAV